MVRMEGGARRKMLIPRWVQLVGLPIVALLLWAIASTISHALFIFVVAALIAILLNPVVRAVCAFRVPRALAVLAVYLTAALVVVGTTVIIGSVVAREVSSLANLIYHELTNRDVHGVSPAEHLVDHWQVWINQHSPVKVNIRQPAYRALNGIDTQQLQKYSGQAVDVAQGLVITLFTGLFNLVLVVVISIYMLLDAPRLSRFLRRVFPSDDPSDDLVTRAERALLSYIRGQTLVCLVIGVSSGVALWILGVVGIFPDGEHYALAFGAWTAVAEVIPYLGPWLGFLAPAVVAATESLTAVIAVALVYLAIQQIEGHVVIPKLMGGAVKVHPLVVIFALLAGEEAYGLPGIFLALPLVAVCREVGVFLLGHIGLESWRGAPIPIEVPVEVHPPPSLAPPPPAPAESPPPAGPADARGAAEEPAVDDQEAGDEEEPTPRRKRGAG